MNKYICGLLVACGLWTGPELIAQSKNSKDDPLAKVPEVTLGTDQDIIGGDRTRYTASDFKRVVDMRTDARPLSEVQLTGKVQRMKNRIKSAKLDKETMKSNYEWEKPRLDEMTRQEREILIETLDELMKVPAGRRALELAHPGLEFAVQVSPRFRFEFYAADNRLEIMRRLFQEVMVDDPAISKPARLELAGIIARNATISGHFANAMAVIPRASVREKIILRKLSELAGVLSYLEVQEQLNDLPSYQVISRPPGEMNMACRSLYYYLVLQEVKLAKAGGDREKAGKLVREDMAAQFWRDKYTEVSYNFEGRINITAFAIFATLGRIESDTIYKIFPVGMAADGEKVDPAARGLGIGYVVKRYMKQMGIDMETNFFLDPANLPVKITTQRMSVYYRAGSTGYEMLPVGLLRIDYTRGNHPPHAYFMPYRKISAKDGEYKVYDPETKKLRLIYTLKDKKLNGIYREYNENGEQELEILFKDDCPDGPGWHLKDGEKRNFTFKNGHSLYI